MIYTFVVENVKDKLFISEFIALWGYSKHQNVNGTIFKAIFVSRH